MNILNLTPHSIDIYSPEQFVNLQQINPTTWVADGVVGDAIASFPSIGSARITTQTTPAFEVGGIPCYRTEYGEATGIPANVSPQDILIVSLPMQTMAIQSGHPYASRMASPYQVVRLRDANGGSSSTVLGCTGLSFQ